MHIYIIHARCKHAHTHTHSHTQLNSSCIKYLHDWHIFCPNKKPLYIRSPVQDHFQSPQLSSNDWTSQDDKRWMLVFLVGGALDVCLSMCIYKYTYMYIRTWYTVYSIYCTCVRVLDMLFFVGCWLLLLLVLFFHLVVASNQPSPLRNSQKFTTIPATGHKQLKNLRYQTNPTWTDKRQMRLKLCR